MLICYCVHMDDWRSRLLEAVDKDDRSDRAISLSAKLGPNFVNELRNGEKEPGVNKVIKLAELLGLSLAFVFSGADVSAQEEADLRLFLSLSSASRQAMLHFARQIKEAEHGDVAAPGPPGSVQQ